MKDDKTRPAKQRHTAKGIFERLKEEHGFSGGYAIVKEYVLGEETAQPGDVRVAGAPTRSVFER